MNLKLSKEHIRKYEVFTSSVKYDMANQMFHLSTQLNPQFTVLCNKKSGRGAVKLDSMWQHRLTRPLHVQHTYYRIIFNQNPFNIISRGVQGCTSTDFRLK